LNTSAFQLLVEYGNAGRTALVDIKQDFWNSEGGFIPSLLRFFETREAPAPEAQTLEIMALIEAGTKAMDKPHKWVKVNR
jgi:hypothetical protein